MDRFETGHYVQPESDVAKSSDRTGIVVGESVWINNMVWTPVLWDDKEDPSFFKTGCLEDYQPVTNKLEKSVKLNSDDNND